VSIVDTLLVDGTDLRTLARDIADFSGVFSVAPRRGNNYQVPGADGAIYVAKPADVGPVIVGLTIEDVDPATGLPASTRQARLARLWANYFTLVSLCKAETGGTVTLTRRLATTGGSTVDHTCTAELVGGLDPVLDGAPTVIRVVTRFANLDGTWS
jgi:hypothetical protein